MNRNEIIEYPGSKIVELQVVAEAGIVQSDDGYLKYQSQSSIRLRLQHSAEKGGKPHGGDSGWTR